jgi:DNA-binding MarR family transcriptional regulator
MEQMRTCAHILRHRNGKNSQQHILAILGERGAMTQRDLMEVLDVRSASVSEILSKVESDGLIRRSKNETDKRSVDVTLTKSGHAEAARIDAHRADHAEEMFSCLTAEEKALLSALLEKLLAGWRTHGGEHKNPLTQGMVEGEPWPGEHTHDHHHHHHYHHGERMHTCSN